MEMVHQLGGGGDFWMGVLDFFCDGGGGPLACCWGEESDHAPFFIKFLFNIAMSNVPYMYRTLMDSLS